MLSYPSGMTVSNRVLGLLADALRAHRTQLATRGRKLAAGRQAGGDDHVRTHNS